MHARICMHAPAHTAHAHPHGATTQAYARTRLQNPAPAPAPPPSPHSRPCPGHALYSHPYSLSLVPEFTILGPTLRASYLTVLGCDTCTRQLKEIDATLAIGMRHPAPLSSHSVRRGHAREPRGASRLAKSPTGQNTVASFGKWRGLTNETSLLRVSKRQRLPGLIYALKTGLALPLSLLPFAFLASLPVTMVHRDAQVEGGVTPAVGWLSGACPLRCIGCASSIPVSSESPAPTMYS